MAAFCGTKTKTFVFWSFPPRPSPDSNEVPQACRNGIVPSLPHGARRSGTSVVYLRFFQLDYVLLLLRADQPFFDSSRVIVETRASHSLCSVFLFRYQGFD